MDDALSYPFISGNPLTVTLQDKTYDGKPIGAPSYSTNAGTVYVGDEFTLAASGGSGDGAVSWEVVSGPATIDASGVVRVTGTGEVKIKATKAGGTSYNDASVEVTLTATNRPSSGGGTGPTRYPVIVEDVEHGAVDVSPENPTRGQTVTITPEPDEGFEVGSVEVAGEGGEPVEVADNGDGDGSFSPAGELSREQAACVLYNREQAAGEDVSARADLSRFGDAGQVSGWAEEVMGWAVAEGVFNGSGQGLLGPGRAIARSELCAVLMNWEARE